jgi:hypothetical protein
MTLKNSQEEPASQEQLKRIIEDITLALSVVGGVLNLYSLYAQFILSMRNFDFFLDMELGGIVLIVFAMLLLMYSALIGPHSS